MENKRFLINLRNTRLVYDYDTWIKLPEKNKCWIYILHKSRKWSEGGIFIKDEEKENYTKLFAVVHDEEYINQEEIEEMLVNKLPSEDSWWACTYGRIINTNWQD